MTDVARFSGNITQVDGSRGGDWLKLGIQQFAQQRQRWMLMMLLLMVISLFAVSLPVLGPFMIKVLAPALTAGMFSCCFKLQQGEEFVVTDVFNGLREKPRQLIRLGLLYTFLLLMLSYVLLMFFIANGGQPFVESIHALNELMQAGDKPDFSVLVMPEKIVLVKSILLWLVLFVPIFMLMLFAPLLVLKYDLDVLQSVKMSLRASWLNRAALYRYMLGALLIFSIMLAPILLLAMIASYFGQSVLPVLSMMLLVIGMLILRPIFIASVYAAHQDIFLDQKDSNYLEA